MIWARKELTTHKKMQLLYDLTASYLKMLSLDVLYDPIVSIHYGQAKSTVYTTTSSAWFMRVFSPKKSEEALVKRETEAGLESENKSHSNKKRKVRDGKRRDIGSMLGSFAT